MTIKLTIKNEEIGEGEEGEEKVAVVFNVDPIGNKINKRVIFPQDTCTVYILNTQSISIEEGL